MDINAQDNITMIDAEALHQIPFFLGRNVCSWEGLKRYKLVTVEYVLLRN